MARCRERYLRSSVAESSPTSSFCCASFLSSPLSPRSRFLTYKQKLSLALRVPSQHLNASSLALWQGQGF